MVIIVAVVPWIVDSHAVVIDRSRMVGALAAGEKRQRGSGNRQESQGCLDWFHEESRVEQFSVIPFANRITEQQTTWREKSSQRRGCGGHFAQALSERCRNCLS